MSIPEPLPAVTSESDDWPAKLTATLVGYVDTVRSATTGKALVLARVVVYFLAIGLIALVAAILALVLLVRFLVVVTAYLPFVDPGEVWPTYLLLGALFTLLGLIFWRKKEA